MYPVMGPPFDLITTSLTCGTPLSFLGHTPSDPRVPNVPNGTLSSGGLFPNDPQDLPFVELPRSTCP